MKLFDKMFGHGADTALKQPGAEDKFNKLKQKYQTVLNTIDQQGVQLQNLHVEGDKLVIRGIAPSDQAKNTVWDQIKLVDPNVSDLTADITCEPAALTSGVGRRAVQWRGRPAIHGEGWRHALEDQQAVLRNAHEYMRIFYANRNQLSDPDKIKVGQQLVIPPDDNS
jgi:hypothetical protein